MHSEAGERDRLCVVSRGAARPSAPGTPGTVSGPRGGPKAGCTASIRGLPRTAAWPSRSSRAAQTRRRWLRGREVPPPARPRPTHAPLKGRRARAQAAAGQRRARALDKHTALHTGPSRRTVRNLHPCPARVHFGGVSYRGALSGPRRQTREALYPGAVYDSRELETAGGPISRGLHSTQ